MNISMLPTKRYRNSDPDTVDESDTSVPDIVDDLDSVAEDATAAENEFDGAELDATAVFEDSSDSESADGTDDLAQSGISAGNLARRLLMFVGLPLMVLILAGICGYLKWQVQTNRDGVTARTEATQAAKNSTIALLSYRPDTVEQQLRAARELLTGEFRDSYTSLTTDIVIPSAKEKQISAEATVSAAASVSATPIRAVALVFVNQTTIVGSGVPTSTSSVVRVGLDKVGGKWLVSAFDPV